MTKEAQITSAEYALGTPRAYTHARPHTVCIYTYMSANERKITERDLIPPVPEQDST